MYSRTDLLIGSAVVTIVAGIAWVCWRFGFFILPFAWTGEPARLATLLGVQPGMRVADIGAGTGTLAYAMTTTVGPSGELYATEVSKERLQSLSTIAPGVGRGRFTVVQSTPSATGLADHCCDAAYMRAMLHHVADVEAYAASARRALVPGGRLAVIDFPPGGLPFHGADHGITRERAVDAFSRAGFQLRAEADNWGGGMFMLLFVKSQAEASRSQVDSHRSQVASLDRAFD